MTSLGDATREELREELRRRLDRMPEPRPVVTPDDLRAAYEVVEAMALMVAKDSRGGHPRMEWTEAFVSAFRLVYGLTHEEWTQELRR